MATLQAIPANLPPQGPQYLKAAGRLIYRGTDRGRALDYVAKGDTKSIRTTRLGDSHQNLNKNTAYFIFSERYADLLASEEHPGMVIQQRVPTEILDRAYFFNPKPDKSWRKFVQGNRAQDPLDGELRRAQHARVVIGPTANVSTRTLNNKLRKLPYESQAYQDAFSPAISVLSDSDSDIDPDRRGRTYTQQIAISGDDLEALSKLARYARPAKPYFVATRRSAKQGGEELWI